MKKILSPVLAFLKTVLLRLGHIQARVLLILIYTLLILPLGFLVGFFSDLLGTQKKEKETFWIIKNPTLDIKESSRKQF